MSEVIPPYNRPPSSDRSQIPPPLPPLPPPDIVLSSEQKRVLNIVERGENVFFTGSAGIGGRGSSQLAITASTGIAGVNIGGTTIHSWAGIGLGQEGAKKLAGKFLGQPKLENVRDRWRSVQTLIIDESFVNMLNLLRWGNLTKEVIQAFKSLARPVHYTDGIDPTELYPTRAEVERANWSRLEALSGATCRYEATDTPGIDSYGIRVTIPQMERVLDRLVSPRSIQLKVRWRPSNANQDLKNLVQGHLVNGSVGQVVRFSTPQEASRNKTEVGTEEGAKGNKAEALQEVERYSDARWPVVRFTNGRELLCVPADFTVHNANGEMEARRRQVHRQVSFQNSHLDN
ncbi:hypothetical protein ID866_389 [Astraeus odoratus]|nr:hypothetical protein ID866_389 [Astraeus odoratus]